MLLNKATIISFDFFVVEFLTYILEEFTHARAHTHTHTHTHIYIYIYIMKDMMYIPNV